MTELEFLRGEAVRALLRRAQTAAGVPLSLHYLERNQEGPKICAWGHCGACSYVSEIPGGKQACRQSRQTVSSMAVRQGRALPYICHMGFSCVSVPALEGKGFVLTFGPYCPAEEARSLPFDVLAGLNALLPEDSSPFELFPISLDDVHHAPSASIPEIAAWTVEQLRLVWESLQREEMLHASPAEDEAEYEGLERRTKSRGVVAVAAEAADLVASVAASDYKLARTLLESDIAESQRGQRFKKKLAAARAVKMLASAMEGLEVSGLLNESAWDAWPPAVKAIRSAEDISGILEASVSFLRKAARIERRGSGGDTPKLRYEALNAILSERLLDRVSLEEVAAVLGETPSAITHRLQRKFGMSYSEYVGRMRVDKAKELLRRTKLSATEVAKRVGVRDQSNFGKLFKKYAGMPPQMYREQYGRKS